MKNKENIIIPIISLIVAISGIVLVFFSQTIMVAPFAVLIALVLSYISFFINKNNGKILSYVSIIFTTLIIAVFLVIGTYFVSKVKDIFKDSDNISKSFEQSQKNFKWTKQSYNTIKLQKEIDYDAIIEKFGKPTSSSASEGYDTKSLYLSWDSKGEPYKSVSLSLEKEEGEQWTVTSKNQTGLD